MNSGCKSAPVDEFWKEVGLDKEQATPISDSLVGVVSDSRRYITTVVPNDDFTLTLTFDNGEVRLYDVTPMLQPDTVFAL